MDPIDKLLAQLKAEYADPTAATPPQPPTPPLPTPPPPAPPSNPPTIRKSVSSFDPIDNLLSEVKAGYAAQEAAEELVRQQLQAEQRRQAQLLEQRRAAIAQQAKDWLAKLDPLSTEGLWFEQFSHKYSSKLEAAIDYLLASETP